VYSSIAPEIVFRKSRIGDASMDDWIIEYELVEKSFNPKGLERATVSLTSNHWSRSHKFKRPVKQITLNRTVPATDNPLFQFRKKLSVHGKWANKKMAITTSEVAGFDVIKRQSERVLGKSLENFKLIEVKFTLTRRQQRAFRIVVDNIEESDDGTQIITRRKIPIEPRGPKVSTSTQLMYVGATEDVTYSEFNFGSGESSVIRTISEIENMPDGSLVLIEEIENGLHPLAVGRMVEYLMDVAQRKKIQSIFTTHSDYALAPLPSEAIWACVDRNLQQGKLSVEILRAVSGRVDRRLAVFVEDEFAKVWIEAIAREYFGSNFEEIGIYPVQGDGNAVRTHNAHQLNPAVSFRSVCFIDGDSQQRDDPSSNIFRLPGANPELTVFNAVLANLDENIAVLTAACQRPITKQEQVAKVIREVSQTNRDPHLLFNQVGVKLGLISEAIIRGAFIAVWVAENSATAAGIATTIKKGLEEPLQQ